MINFLKTNAILKLFSFLLAILMWVYVVQVENPRFETTIHGVPIQFIHQELLEERGLMITKISSEEINIRAAGKRQSVIGLKAADVSAVIDVGTIQQAGVYSFAPVLTFPEDGISVTERTPHAIAVTVDLKMELKKEISAEVTGSPKDGYYAAEPELYQKEVAVQGPSSLLNQIAKVSASVDVEGAKKDVKKQVRLKLLRADGSQIESDKIVISTSVVTVVCKVYPTKKVKLEYDVTGTLDIEDYVLQDTTISNSSIMVAGTEEVLSQLERIQIGTFDLSELTTKNYKKVFPIPLPDYLISVDGIKNVAVEAVLISDRKKLIEITRYEMVHLDPEVQAEVITQTLLVEIEGDKEILEKVNADSFTVSLDLEGCLEGSYLITPEIRCNVDGVAILGDYTVEVFLK